MDTVNRDASGLGELGAASSTGGSIPDKRQTHGRTSGDHGPVANRTGGTAEAIPVGGVHLSGQPPTAPHVRGDTVSTAGIAVDEYRSG